MVSHHDFSPLVLFALLWLVVIVHLIRSKRPVTAPATPTEEPEPLKPKQPRSHEPKPFEGLTHKPQCALCERDTASPQAPLPVPPNPMPPTNRRPREIDTSRHFCPHAGCDDRGWLGLGNLRANGHPSGGPWRQFHCTSCEGYFLETHGTLFHGRRVSVELMVCMLACLAEGLGIRATARLFEVDPNTVLGWLVEAADQVQPDRRQATGPSPKPRWMPLPGLLYARVIKTTRRRRLVRVTHRVVLGTLEAVEHVLAACGWQINTAFVERLNLDIRQRMAAVGRRVATLCKGEGGLQHQLVVFHAYHYTAHLHQNGPRLYKLSRGYDAPEVAAAVERIGAEQQAKRAA